MEQVFLANFDFRSTYYVLRQISAWWIKKLRNNLVSTGKWYIYIEPKRSDVDQTEATWIGKISNKTIQGARIAKYHREERYFLLYIRHGDKFAQIVTSVSRWFGCWLTIIMIVRTRSHFSSLCYLWCRKLVFTLV